MASTNSTNTNSSDSKPQTGSSATATSQPAAGVNRPSPAASTAVAAGKKYEVINPTSTALNLYIKVAGGFVDIPAEGKSEPLALDKDALAAVKKSLNKYPAVRVQEVKDEDKGQ